MPQDNAPTTINLARNANAASPRETARGGPNQSRPTQPARRKHQHTAPPVDPAQPNTNSVTDEDLARALLGLPEVPDDKMVTDLALQNTSGTGDVPFSSMVAGLAEKYGPTLPEDDAHLRQANTLNPDQGEQDVVRDRPSSPHTPEPPNTTGESQPLQKDILLNPLQGADTARELPAPVSPRVSLPAVTEQASNERANSITTTIITRNQPTTNNTGQESILRPTVPTMPTLPRGFPATYYETDVKMKALWDPRIKENLDKIDTPKLIAHFMAKGYPPSPAEAVAEFRTFFSEITGIAPNEYRATLALAKTPGTPNQGPFEIIVHGILPELREELLRQRILVAGGKALVFTPYDRTPTTPSFITTYDGFTAAPNEEGIAIIRDAVHKQLSDNSAFESFVANYNDAYELSMDEWIKVDVLNSLEVRPITLAGRNASGTGRTVWNVYLDPPSLIPSHHEEFINVLNGISILTDYDGSGQSLVNPLHCNFCKGKDHTVSTCPFPLLPGWSGPTLNTTPTTRQNTTRGRGGGRRGNIVSPRGRNGRNLGY
jgi:hypothetical protein